MIKPCAWDHRGKSASRQIKPKSYPARRSGWDEITRAPVLVWGPSTSTLKMSHYSPFGQTRGDWGKPIGLQFPRAIQHLLPPFDTIIKFSLGMMGRRPPWSELMEVVSDMFDYHRLSYSSWKLFWGVTHTRRLRLKNFGSSVTVYLFSDWVFPVWRTPGCVERMAAFSLAPYDTYSFICLANSLRSRALHIDLSAGEILSETL